MNLLASFIFELPTRIEYGIGASGKLVDAFKQLKAEKVLVVTDKGIESSGLLSGILQLLTQNKLKFDVFSAVEANPKDYNVHAGTELACQMEADCLVALGGGSPIDCAKAIAVAATHGGDIREYEAGNKITGEVLPLIAIPTTAGTGSEVTFSSVITDTSRDFKFSIHHFRLAPRIALLDPEMTLTMPPALTAATGMDALTHAIEAYVSSLSWSLTDPHACHAIKLVFRHLKKAVQRRSLDPLEGMAIASLEAGAAFSNAILGAVHALAHPLGGRYDIHHGLANAILLPVVLQKNLEHAPEKYALIANAMGIDTRGKSSLEAAQQVPAQIEGLIRALDIPTRLSQLGVRKEDIPYLALDAAEDLCMNTNPQRYDAAEIESLYLNAL